MGTIEDIYRLNMTDIRSHNGRGLLEVYDFSLSTLIQTIYPEHDWQTGLFEKTENGFWDMENQEQIMQQVTQLLP